LFSAASASFWNIYLFLSHLNTGKNKKVKITQTKVLPKTENKNDFQTGSACSPQNETAEPKGIAPLSSTIGIIEIIIVASHEFEPKIVTNKSFIHSDITNHP